MLRSPSLLGFPWAYTKQHPWSLVSRLRYGRTSGPLLHNSNTSNGPLWHPYCCLMVARAIPFAVVYIVKYGISMMTVRHSRTCNAIENRDVNFMSSCPSSHHICQVIARNTISCWLSYFASLFSICFLTTSFNPTWLPMAQSSLPPQYLQSSTLLLERLNFGCCTPSFLSVALLIVFHDAVLR